MGAFSALKEMFDRREPLSAPMDDPFVHPDRRTISSRLSLAARGTEGGSRELPPTDHATLDAVEREITVEISEHYARAQIEAANSIRTYDSRLADLALLSRLSSIGTEAKRAVSDFKAAVALAQNRLSNNRDAIGSSYAELQEFREANDIKRPAHIVPSSVSTYGTITLAWLSETVLNAFLLKQNDSFGYLGGVLAAAAVATINVVVSALVGRHVWPRAHLRHPAAKASAWLGIALWFAFVLLWNLLAAHYRDAKSLNLPNPETAAFTLMTSGLEGIYSAALLIAGIVFAFMSAHAGYRMKDPYPGYGDITDRHQKRCDDYVEEVARVTDELRDIRDEAIDATQEVHRELDRQLAERTQILASRDAFRRRYSEFGDQLEGLANSLLQEYRGANLAARASPPPAHFKSDWVLVRGSLPESPPVSFREEAVSATEVALERAVSETTAAFDAAIASFEPLDSLKARLSRG